MNEIWKDVLGYEGKYLISNSGTILNVMREPNKVRRHVLVAAGYPAVALSNNGVKKQFLIHRLIAIHFIDNPENKPEINHINGIKTDFSPNNLEWCTSSENQIHSYKNKLQIAANGEGHYRSMLKNADIDNIRNKYIPKIYTQKMLSIEYGVHRTTIGQIINHKRWK